MQINVGDDVDDVTDDGDDGDVIENDDNMKTMTISMMQDDEQHAGR